MDNVLKIGQKVMCKGTWGTEEPKEQTIKNLYINRATNKEVDFKLTHVSEVDWKLFVGRDYIADFTNDTWGYANQISPIE